MDKQKKIESLSVWQDFPDCKQNSCMRVVFTGQDILLRTLLGEISAQVNVASKVENFFKELLHFNPDLLIVDLVSPDYSDINILRILHSDYRFKTLPVVVVSDVYDESTTEKAFEYGVDNFFVRPIEGKAFQQCVQHVIERRRAFDKICNTDPLTGLKNRHAFKQIFQDCISEEEQGVFALVDMDRLKNINDAYGHSTGDALLIRVTRLFLMEFQSIAHIARWGGDEFVMFFPGKGKEEVEEKFQEAQELWGELSFNQETLSSFSVGLGRYPEEGTRLEDLFIKADQRLYAMKG